MNKDTSRSKKLAVAARDTRKPHREPFLAQIASFVDLFVWLLVLKSFFLPLFIIPTGSMAETLAGAHATHTCPNCGCEYAVNFRTSAGPHVVQCPNCRYQQEARRPDNPDGVRLNEKAGDRIVVHGWPYDIGGRFGPRRWDVVVFKNPNEPDINYIKRLIGLPGETIELIDGDIFVKGQHDDALHLARKTPQAQRSLWFPYYDHDYPPRESTQDWVGRQENKRSRWPAYHPRWVARSDQSGWEKVDTRTPRFNGTELPHSQIQFVTRDDDDTRPGRIFDVYGYNAYERDLRGPVYNDVTDVRLSTDVEIEDGDGYVELSISKYDDFFYARLHADGRLTLEHARSPAGQRELWGQQHMGLPARPIQFALGHADYRVAVEIDGRTALESSPARYSIMPKLARQRSPLVRRPGQIPPAPRIRIAAQRVQAAFAHLLIERDVYYVSANLRDRGVIPGGRPGTATQGHPITLKDDAYFVCGDNSPASHDSRAWSEQELGPHLRAAYTDGKYDIGTVPADQMIGRAFFVYWPGFLPLGNTGLNILPDLGRLRWIN